MMLGTKGILTTLILGKDSNITMEWIQLWQLHGLALLTGSILDWIFGDPYNFPHMIRLMGNMISSQEKDLRKLFLKSHGLQELFLP